MTRLLETKIFILLYMLYLQTKIKEFISLIGAQLKVPASNASTNDYAWVNRKFELLLPFDKMNFLLFKLYPKFNVNFIWLPLSCFCENR